MDVIGNKYLFWFIHSKHLGDTCARESVHVGDVQMFDWTNKYSSVASKSFGLFLSLWIFTGQSEQGSSSGNQQKPSEW